jgi:hypothetical protein
MSAEQLAQIARSAIETGLAVVHDSGEITQERAGKFLRRLESELEIWSVPGDSVAEMATFDVDGAIVTLDELKEAYQLREAVWTRKFINDLPDGSFALILPGGKKDTGGKTTPRTLRKLPFKDGGGKVDLPHLRNALARISQMTGVTSAQRASAQKKLDAAAKKHLKTEEAAVDIIAEMEGIIKAHLEEVAGSLRDTANRVEDAFHSAYSPADRWEGPYRTRDVFMAHPVLGDAVVALDKRVGGLFSVGFTMGEDGIEFAPPAEWQPVELTYSLIQVQEMESDGVAVSLARDATEADLSEVDAAIETGRRAPVVIDFQVLQPGPGNSKDNHYYPADVVERDINVFNGVDVFATDHKEKERSERTKVGKVLSCPTRFTESKAPVAQVLLYDPDQAEKARNRADADALDTLECSIFGSGQAKEGDIDGKTYKIVESITRGRYLELVSKAGAGGKALNLAESNPGGETVDDKDKTDAAPVEEVEIEEADVNAKPERPDRLELGVITEALAKTNLPEFVKRALVVREYESDSTLQKAIAEATAEVKKLSGSGQVTDLGESAPTQEPELSLEEREKRDVESFNDIMREAGLREV